MAEDVRDVAHRRGRRPEFRPPGQPGSEVPEHEHQGIEHVYILDGEQSDERGTYRKGSFVINPPGTSHRVWSSEGCLVLIVWQRPVAFKSDSVLR